MFRRVLIKRTTPDEPRHKRSLFRIKYKILGKVCKVMVDSKSTNNIISEDIVTKIKLKKIPHENPYKVTWLNKQKTILVNEQAWVDFSIAGYKDWLLCDIFPMDACHLFLGKPWKFDTKVVYDGRANAITFKKGSKTFKI